MNFEHLASSYILSRFAASDWNFVHLWDRVWTCFRRIVMANVVECLGFC